MPSEALERGASRAEPAEVRTNGDSYPSNDYKGEKPSPHNANDNEGAPQEAQAGGEGTHGDQGSGEEEEVREGQASKAGRRGRRDPGRVHQAAGGQAWMSGASLCAKTSPDAADASAGAKSTACSASANSTAGSTAAQPTDSTSSGANKATSPMAATIQTAAPSGTAFSNPTASKADSSSHG